MYCPWCGNHMGLGGFGPLLWLLVLLLVIGVVVAVVALIVWAVVRSSR